MQDIFSVAGKTALVTGGSSGIGMMIAEGLLRRGVRVYLVARDCAAAVAELKAHGDCRGLAADLSTSKGVTDAAAGFLAAEPALHILVNCAGLNHEDPLDDFSEAGWDQVVDLNMKAPFFLTQKLLPALRAAAEAEHPASVINISSIGANRVFTGDNYSYGASKAGLQHLTRMMARRLGPEHITVNAIAPGLFPSRMSAPTPQKIANYTAVAAMRRIGDLQDMEGLTVFLASRAGAFVTGEVITLDGGRTL